MSAKLRIYGMGKANRSPRLATDKDVVGQQSKQEWNVGLFRVIRMREKK